MSFGVTMFLRPFVALAFMFFVVRPLARLLWRAIPAGRIKAALFRPLPGYHQWWRR